MDGEREENQHFLSFYFKVLSIYDGYYKCQPDFPQYPGICSDIIVDVSVSIFEWE